MLKTEASLDRAERARLVGEVVRDLGRHNLPARATHARVEELISVDRRKDESLAVLSHELRSPLTALSYALKLLGGEKGMNPARQKTHALMERQLKRMSRLIDELLDVSLIGCGRLQLKMERIDLRDVVRNAIATLQSQLESKDHRLSTALPEQPVWLQGDAGRLEQVFVNLLANASRYTDAGGELSVWVHTRQGQAIVRIRDRGVGITRDAMPHIFDLFRQADSTDGRSAEGLGIGLAVVRNLVELHGGSVTAASAGAGRGSEFAVRLPTQDGPGSSAGST